MSDEAYNKMSPELWTRSIRQVAEKLGTPNPDIIIDKDAYSRNHRDFELQYFPKGEIIGTKLGLDMFGEKIIPQIPGAKHAGLIPTYGFEGTTTRIGVQGTYNGDLNELKHNLDSCGYKRSPELEEFMEGRYVFRFVVK